MASKGYTSAALVADELGRSLTAEQLVQAAGLIEEAEAYVDNATGRAWLVTSPVADELHVLVGPTVYLTNTPVATVTAVTIRSSAIGATETVLVAGTGYELLDPATGLLSLSSYPLADPVANGSAYSPGALVKVSYTFTSPLPLPADIRRATTLLVAAWMTPRLDPSMATVSEVSVGQGDLAVTYRAAGGDAEYPTPPLVEAILRGYRRLVFA